jgi:hypothetical protein
MRVSRRAFPNLIKLSGSLSKRKARYSSNIKRIGEAGQLSACIPRLMLTFTETTARRLAINPTIATSYNVLAMCSRHRFFSGCMAIIMDWAVDFATHAGMACEIGAGLKVAVVLENSGSFKDDPENVLRMLRLMPPEATVFQVSLK